MEWINSLRGKIVGLDTAPLIYFIEEHPDYLEHLRPFFKAVDQGELKIVTSLITLLEVLVHPFRSGNTQLAQQYRDILLHSENLLLVPLSQELAEKAAQLRAQYNLRTPDAIQIATALHQGASVFVTNDTRLPLISELQVLVVEPLIQAQSGSQGSIKK